MYITGRDKLVSYKSDGWYKGYNKDTGRWEELIQYPEWRDGGTSGCAHPDGVILAGAADHKTCNHVVLLNVRTKQPVPFPGNSCDVLICHVNIMFSTCTITCYLLSNFRFTTRCTFCWDSL